jgi:hypothetical protein
VAHTPSPDVSSYFSAKNSYGVEVRRRIAALDSPYHVAAMKDLESRLRAIIGLDSIGALPLTSNVEHLFLGEDGSNGLDGLVARRGTERILVTTPELLTYWIRGKADSISNPFVALETENVLTWVFDEDAHAYRFADLRPRASFPSGTFLAQLIDRTNGDPMGASEVVVGVSRGRRVYIMIDLAATLVKIPQCGEAWRDEYRSCFDQRVASHPSFPKIVAQVKALIAGLPEH